MKIKFFIALLFLLFSEYAFSKELTALETIDTKRYADELFSFGSYEEAIKIYYDLSNQKNASNNVKADSFKKAGLVKFHWGNYIETKSLFNKAKNMGLFDQEMKQKLDSISKIRSFDNQDGAYTYIIQVGLFKSSVNANNVIKNMNHTTHEFALNKKKEGGFYIVYFDGFKNRTEADEIANQLEALNHGLNFFVRIK